MKLFTRRRIGRAALAGAALLLAACGNPIGTNNSQRIDARADSTLEYLFRTHPEARQTAEKASGMLIMPVVTEGGFMFGAGYGRGVLRVGGATVDYYSAAKGSFGFQIGAQQFAHILFFMTDDALSQFRRSPGWVAGANIAYALKDSGAALQADTTTTTSPVVAMVFGQSGLLAGAAIEGLKYTRIIP